MQMEMYGRGLRVQLWGAGGGPKTPVKTEGLHGSWSQQTKGHRQERELRMERQTLGVVHSRESLY